MITITIPEKHLKRQLKSRANKEREEDDSPRKIIVHMDNKKIGSCGDIVRVKNQGYFAIEFVNKGIGAAGFCRVIDNSRYFLGCYDEYAVDEYANDILNILSAPGTFPPETYLYTLEEVFGLEELLGPVEEGQQ